MNVFSHYVYSVPWYWVLSDIKAQFFLGLPQFLLGCSVSLTSAFSTWMCAWTQAQFNGRHSFLTITCFQKFEEENFQFEKAWNLFLLGKASDQ